MTRQNRAAKQKSSAREIVLLPGKLINFDTDLLYYTNILPYFVPAE